MLKTLNATTIQASSVNDLNGLNKCKRITTSTCQGLGYNLTMIPNLAGHNDINDANLMVIIVKMINYIVAFFLLI